jgi:hypothetical protein
MRVKRAGQDAAPDAQYLSSVNPLTQPALQVGY